MSLIVDWLKLVQVKYSDICSSLQPIRHSYGNTLALSLQVHSPLLSFVAGSQPVVEAVTTLNMPLVELCYGVTACVEVCYGFTAPC